MFTLFHRFTGVHAMCRKVQDTAMHARVPFESKCRRSIGAISSWLFGEHKT